MILNVISLDFVFPGQYILFPAFNREDGKPLILELYFLTQVFMNKMSIQLKLILFVMSCLRSSWDQKFE